MSAPTFPEAMPQVSLKHLLRALSLWATKASAEADLETIFGPRLNWPSAFKHLDAFRRSDFSLLPPVRTLPATDMPRLWGGYSRETREIYISSDCPQALLPSVLVEEIGHFLDQELCFEETPGEEGAHFAAAVLGLPLDAASQDDALAPLSVQGRTLLVEAARKIRGSGKSKTKKRGSSKSGGSQKNGGSGYAEIGSKSSNPKLQQNIIYATDEGVRIPQRAAGDRLIGSRGNDTFAVISQDVRIEDPNGGTDTVESSVTFDLANRYSSIENLLLTGGGNTNATGNFKSNVISGNSGNNKLDGGVDSVADTLIGGAGNDTYALRDTLDQIIEAVGGGSDTIETDITSISLTDFIAPNVENLTYTGNLSATLSGNSLANVITGGNQADTIFGAAGDTLVGREGDDLFNVQSASVYISEGDGASSGQDTVSTALSTYSIAPFANLEVLKYSGGSNSSLTGNSENNTVLGGLLVRNTIDGGAGDDYLFGGDGTDSLFGGSGNDTLAVTAWLGDPIGSLGVSLRSGVGSDTLNGGAGDDWYVVNSQTGYTFQDTLGTNTIASTVNFSLKYNPNIAANVQNLYLIGDSPLLGTGSDKANTITGNDGNNVIFAGAGADSVFGGLGADYIAGEAGNDSLFGGGQPQADLPADASTAILLRSGQSFVGSFDFRNDEDWIKVSFNEGETYRIQLLATLSGNEKFKENSWILLGDPLKQDGSLAYGDVDYLNERFEVDGSYWWSYNYDGYDDGRFEVIYNFTAFDSGEFFIPVGVGGPSTGRYELSLQSSGTGLAPGFSQVFADDAQNTLVGGAGSDFLVAGTGRDSVGNPIGDFLFGGTNGISGAIDLDTVSGANSDTLIGGDGGDLLDGGNGADSMRGGAGNDTYYVNDAADYVGDAADSIVEGDSQGTDDLAVFSLLAKGDFSKDLAATTIEGGESIGKFAFLDSVSATLNSLTGAGFDIDLANDYQNVEHASLMGSANLYVLGNGDANSLLGNFGKNLLVGGHGNDSLLGQGGTDYLIGGDGGDLLDGGSDVNTMDGGFGSDTYIVNDRADRIINEKEGLDGGIDVVRTYFNFDPIQGDGVNQFDPAVADNSPSVNKAKSFASEDLESFYNLENFELLGGAVYGVGNALANSITAGPASSVLYGMGGEDAVLGGDGDDTLYGDTPDFYASPDLYAAAPKDTQTQAFLEGVIGSGGSDYLDGGAGDNYLDAGSGFDTMIGGAGNDTFVQDNVDDYIVAGGGANELITSVNINQAPDGISKLMLVVAKQAADSGQPEVASFASIDKTKNGNNRAVGITTGLVGLSLTNANVLELMYAPRAGEIFAKENGATPNGSSALVVGDQGDDLSNPGKFQYDLSWTVGTTQGQIERSYQDVVGYVVKYKRTDIAGDIWHTYVNGKSQDFQGTSGDPENPFDPLKPTLKVTNLEDGTYDFMVTALERTIPALQDGSAAQHVTLQGGAGNDAVLGLRLTQVLPGGLVDDAYTDPLIQNNPNFSTPLGFIFNPAPYDPTVGMPDRFASYLDGGFGNDILNGDFVNDRSGDDYDLFGGPDKNTLVTFKGLNTLVGGQGSDTFVVKNGGNAIGDEFDWVIKYGNETPVVTQAGNVGSSLNGGQHNLVVSRVDFLTLSDELVNQGKFIDQLALAEVGQFGQGNRLDNYIYDAGLANTLVGDKGRDSIVGAGKGNFLIGGTAYGVDQVGLAVKDFASVVDGGNGTTNSIFRDTDPIPVSPNGPGTADPSQFWFVPGYYGGVYDPNRNQDTLVANDFSDIDGGAGRDSMVGSESENQVAPGKGDMFYVSQGIGGKFSQEILIEDAVFGNGGNDTVTFTDSDYLWWSGHVEGSLLDKNGYIIANDISNLILQAGSPSARDATGNHSSEGNYGQGSNIIEGNEFDNSLNGGGVGGAAGTGTGVDVLIGGSGKDNFVVSGYTASETNEWAPAIIDYTEGPLAGKSVWIRIDSVYTDADYVVVDDFEAGDNLQLAGNASNYWIGAAPSGNGIPSSFVDNIPLLGYLQTPSTTRFGIYTSGTPNLVAIVNLVGGLSLDTLSLELAFDPAPSNTVDTNSPFRNVLGWGTFWKLDGSSFSQYVNQAYVQEDSFASLTTLVRSGDDTFIGGALADFYNGYGGNDSLLGGANNDTLLGGSGNDSLFGQDGDDSLLGQDGADYIDGGAGTDQMIGGTGDDTFVVNTLTDAVTEQTDEGTDLVLASVSGYALTDNVENLTLTGTAINGTGNALGNRLTGNASNNTLTGLAGKDTLDGGAGTDTLQGGADDDTYIVDNTNDTIEENADSLVGGTDIVRTSASFDLSVAKVAGGTGIEHLLYTGTTTGVSLTGNINANSITGAAGSDTLDGNEGDDTLIGGAGDDFYIYTSALASGNDRIVDADGTDAILTATHFDLAATSLNTSVLGLSNIENLQLTSATGASLLGNALNNSITGNDGNDTLDGRGNPDTLSGDTLSGKGGNDYYIVDSTRDEIVESSGGGVDTVETSVDFDLSNTLIGGLKNIENIKGTSGGITLTGNINANSLIGGDGSQYMVGGVGNDTYIVGHGDEASESENQGTDLVVAGTSYTLGANIENLILDGSSNINGTGNALANSIVGNSGNNSLDGVAGNPTLAAYDTLVGGDGSDTYTVHRSEDVVQETNANSLIGGIDLVVAYADYALSDNVENLRLAGTVTSGTGNSLANSLIGNSVGNRLDGGAGVDTFIGGLGDDTYVLDTLGETIVEGASEGTDLVIVSGGGYSLGANIENLLLSGTATFGGGNDLDNSITGNSFANSLDGGDGFDTLVGGSGNDTYVVDTTTDFISDSNGASDMVRSSVSFDLSNTLVGGGAAIEHLVYTGSSAATLLGNASANSITGGAGADSIAGNGGSDTFIGNDGSDTYLVDSTGDLVLETNSLPGGGTDLVVASVSYTIAADSYVEKLELTGSAIFGIGNSIANTITGNSLGNSLDGGEGIDSLTGGAGDDIYIVDNALDKATETDADSLTGGIDLVNASVSYTLAANLERLTLTGTSAISGTGNILDNTITGNSGANSLDGGAGIDSMVGGAGNDTYFVDNAADVVLENSSEGTDLVESSVSYTLGSALENLTLTGTDTISGTGNSLSNTLAGNASANVLDGGTGADSLFGGAGADSLLGGAGEDTLNAMGDSDTDTLIGGADNDAYLVDSASDLIVEAIGGGDTDKVYSSADYALGSNVEHIYLGSGTFDPALNRGMGGYTDTAALTAFGNSLNNSLIGNAGDNVLDGLGGNDTMIGGAGNDTYYVAETGDWVIESLAGESNFVIKAVGLGVYNLSTLASGTVTEITHAVLSLTGENDIVSSNTPVNFSTPLNDTIYGLGGDDSILGGKGSDILDGGTGSDTLLGESGMDTLIGGDGGDSLFGGDGIDSLVGGTGNDTYIIDIAAKDNIYEDSLAAGGNADLIQVNGSFSIADPAPLPIGVPAPGPYAGIEGLIYTGLSSVTLTGNKLANTITSGDGADSIDGGAGADTLIGGKGNDTYIYTKDDSIVESLSEGTDEVRSGVDINLSSSDPRGFALEHIENIVLTGSLNIGATGNTSDNSILGNAASNALSGGDGNDTLVGLGGADILTGGAGANSLVGGAGNDTYVINATANPDGSVTIQDTLAELAGEGTDEIRVAADVDLSQLPDFENVRLTGAGDFNVIGNASSNTITGNTGDNSLDGGTGADSLMGGTGNDTYFVDNASDSVQENGGEGLADMVISSSQSYTLSGNVENLLLIAGAGSAGYGNTDPNMLTGSAGANSLFGDQGDDTILAGLGDDYLEGGFGIDSMVGGLGDDTYVVEGGFDTIVEASTADIDAVILRPRVSANVVNEGQGVAFPDVESITFDVPTGTLAGGGAEIFLSFDTLKSGELNFQNYTPLPLTGGNLSKNPNYFYTLADNIEKLTIENAFVPINGLIYAESSNQPDYVYGNSLANYIVVAGEGLLSNGALVAFDNYIDGQSGADTMAGGFGNDLYIADNAGDLVLEASGQGTDSVRASTTYTIANNVEVLELATVTESLVAGRPVATTLTGAALNFHGTGNAGNNSLFGNAGNNSLFGLDGNDYLVGGDGADTMVGGKGNDTYFVADATDWVIENESPGGGLNYIYVEDDAVGYSTVTLAGGDAILQVVLQGETYGTESADTLTGNPLRDTIYGFGGDDLISGLAGNDSLLGGAGNDFISGGVGSDTLLGESGNDTLLGEADSNSLVGGDGNDSLVSSGNGFDTLLGDAGNDTLLVGSAMNWTVDGGANTDLLSFTGVSVALNNVVLTNIEAVSFSQLTGGGAITLGGNSTGLTTITGGAGSDSITATAASGTRAITLDGGAGGDRFAFDSIAQMKAASLIGGTGNDTLAFSNGSTTLVDGDLTTITSSELEVLEFTGTGNGATLSANAESSGIATVVGGTNNDTINASAYTVDITIDVSRNTVANIGGNDSTVLGGSANDLFIFSNHNVLGNSSVIGGAGRDTLVFSEDGLSVTDGNFTRITGVEALQTKNGTNYINLGSTAATSGLVTLVGGTGFDTIEVSSSFSNQIAIDSGAGNDSITLATAAAINRSTVTGGLDTDTLALSGNDTLTDANLANVTGVEILRAAASGNSSLTVGSNAQAGGIRTVIGGNGNDTLNAGAYTTGMTLGGGTGNDSLVVSTGAILGQSTIVGGSGTDTLSFAIDQLSVTDADFLNVAIEFLKTANGNNRVILGANAQAAGITTLEGGTGNDTLDASSYTSAVTLSGGTGNDSLLSGTGNDWLSGTSTASSGANQIDTLTGGTGNDTFVLGDVTNAYYNTAANGADYALITDFSTGDKFQLKNLNPAAIGNGYLIGSAAVPAEVLYGALGSSNFYLYTDSNNNGTLEIGDNLIAGINSSVALTTANLKSTHGSFV